MKTAIFFMSKHGTTEKVAQLIRQQLKWQHVEIFDLKNFKKISPNRYQTIIIGGSIHAGKIQKRITKFINKHKEILLEKELGLYICCMEKGDTSQQEFNNAYPEELRRMAKAKGILGGELLFDKMNFLEKVITKKTTGKTGNLSEIDHNAIRKFTNDISSPSNT